MGQAAFKYLSSPDVFVKCPSYSLQRSWGSAQPAFLPSLAAFCLPEPFADSRSSLLPPPPAYLRPPSMSPLLLLYVECRSDSGGSPWSSQGSIYSQGCQLSCTDSGVEGPFVYSDSQKEGRRAPPHSLCTPPHFSRSSEQNPWEPPLRNSSNDLAEM